MTEDYVVDTSVLIQAFVTDSYTARARTLVEQMARNRGFKVHTLEFCLVECGNVLWKHVRFKSVSVDTAKRLLSDVLALPVILHSSAEVLPDALSIALSSGLAVYDSTHIALAQKLNLPLITVDQKQAKAASAVGVTLKPITDFPEYITP